MRISRGKSKGTVRLFTVALLVVLALVVAGVAGAEQSTSSAAVKTRSLKHLGVVLVNAKGRTLYVFMKDKHSRVTCTGTCAKYWPPRKWKSARRPGAAGAARGSLLGLDKDPSGGNVVTYHHWPLYTYAGDSAPGQANGQNLNVSGGKWYVISPSGTVVKHKT
jgi:predicted lipoprotein with Yx(FWY)xxD motif